jgi:hypothetical protein
MGMFHTLGSNSRDGVLSAVRQGTRAAAGSSQATGASLPNVVSIITGATGTNGVTLPKAKMMGRVLTIYSSAATNALLIWPPVGGSINNGTTDASFSATARTRYDFMCVSNDGLQWIC